MEINNDTQDVFSMEDKSRMRREIMLRVRFLHVLKRALRPLAIELALCAVVLYGVGKYVFVAKVIENAPDLSRVYDVSTFFFRAFFNTEAVVQLLVLGAIMATAFVMRDLARAIIGLRGLVVRMA